MNTAHLEKNIYEQIVCHLGRDLRLNSLEAPDELQETTVAQHTTITKV